ncbi:MAG: zf-HC2 domain-containing protein [Candidatus Omnitrophota bacterium]
MTDYLDGRLPAGELSGINAHLSGCAACRSALEAARANEDLLRDTPALTPPDSLWTDIRAGIESREEQRTFWTEGLAFLFGAPRRAAVTALATMVILAGATLPMLLGLQGRQQSSTASAALIAFLDERDQVTALNNIDLDTASEYLLNDKGDAI